MSVNLSFTYDEFNALRRQVCETLQGLTVMYDKNQPWLAAGPGGDWLEAETCSPERLVEIAISLGIINI